MKTLQTRLDRLEQRRRPGCDFEAEQAEHEAWCIAFAERLERARLEKEARIARDGPDPEPTPEEVEAGQRAPREALAEAKAKDRANPGPHWTERSRFRG